MYLSPVFHPKSVLDLCRVVKGCFQLTFQVSSFFLQQELFPLSTEQEMFLETECVIELTCGEYQFLDNKDFLEKSQQEIDTSGRFVHVTTSIKDNGQSD